MCYSHESNNFKLLFINVYMLYKNDGCSTNDFADQLICIENVFNCNSDCHIIIGRDFNIDLSRDWCHTVLLNDFCDSTGLQPVARHRAFKIDYSYNLSMSRFSNLDHFLLSGTLFDNSVHSISVLQDIDNLSDHEPMVLRRSLDLVKIGYNKRIHTPLKPMISICLIIAVHCLTYLGILKYQSIVYCAVICYAKI